MSVNFSNLERISLHREARHYAVPGEKLAREQLFNAMQPLGDHDLLNTNFDNCCVYASRFNPFAMGTQTTEVNVFQQHRAQYLKSVLIYAREFFPGDRHAEQKLFQLSQRVLRAIDPALIGEKRYADADWLPYKVYKAMKHFFFGQLYMWAARDQIRMWGARHDILKWGASQDPETALKPPLQIIGLGQSVEGFEIKTTRDQIISQICYKELGFEVKELKVLQTLFQLIPGEISKYTYHPSTGNAHLVLEKNWVGEPKWDAIEKAIKKDIPEGIPEVFAPISFLLEEVKAPDVTGLSALLSALQTFSSGVRIYPKQIRLEVDQHLDVKVDRKNHRIDIQPGKIKVVVPALGGDIQISILSVMRDADGKLRGKIGVGGSNIFFDTTVKSVTKILTQIAVLLEFLKESSASEIEIPEGLPFPDKEAVDELVQEIVPDVFKWKT